jgi:hypothetical protein
MKLVLFSVGLGTRLSAHSDTTPKSPLAFRLRPNPLRPRHYYAQYAHKEFDGGHDFQLHGRCRHEVAVDRPKARKGSRGMEW